jgi:hypothetical protein
MWFFWTKTGKGEPVKKDKTCSDGMVETARGAVAAGAVMWSGIGSEDEREALIGTGAKVIRSILIRT